MTKTAKRASKALTKPTKVDAKTPKPDSNAVSVAAKPGDDRAALLAQTYSNYEDYL